MITKMPSSAIRNKTSAVFSRMVSLLILSVLIDANDRTHETVKINATNEANSSTRLFCDSLEM